MTVHGELLASDWPQEFTDESNNPSTVSMVYANAWEDILLIRTLLAGARAIRAAGQLYLPKFELEDDCDYKTRLTFAPLSNYFVAAHRNIVSRPFTKAVSLQGKTSQNLRDFCEDVDGGGDDLHTFLRDTFARGVAYGRHGILIDYPSVAPAATLADERDAGGRPYWAHVPADSLISCEEIYVDGKKRVVHARIAENSMERQPGSFKESLVRRVRVLDHRPGYKPAWAVYTYEEDEQKKQKWSLTSSGSFSLDFIPLVVFTTGVDESGRLLPPMIDLAHLQIEHYQQSSNLKNVLQLAGFPMLTGNGIQAPVDEHGNLTTVVVGPRAVLFAPPNPSGQVASWGFVEPQGTSIQRIQENIERLERDMAMAGMQPLMRQSGGVTATSEAINAARAHAAAEAWAMTLKDVAEQCLAFTAIWYGEDTSAEVYITTEFGIEMKGDNDVANLMLARDKNAISTATLWDEWKRRDFLGPQFDPTTEVDRIKNDPIPPPPISALKGEGQPPGDGVRPPIQSRNGNIEANRPPNKAASIPGRSDGG